MWYFITFTDDFSKKTWTYFLKDNSSVFDVFKKFKALVERESSCLMTGISMVFLVLLLVVK
jgi:hypothetical protein